MRYPVLLVPDTSVFFGTPGIACRRLLYTLKVSFVVSPQDQVTSIHDNTHFFLEYAGEL
jgi:hypothetical protein